MGARGLREAAVGFHLHGVNEVGELDCVLDEEDRDVVADEIPVAFLGVEFHGKAAHVAGRVDGTCAAGDGGEAGEDGRAFPGALEEIGFRETGQRLVELEKSVCGGTTRVDDALGDALVIEVEDLLAQDEIFEQDGAART